MQSINFTHKVRQTCCKITALLTFVPMHYNGAKMRKLTIVIGVALIALVGCDKKDACLDQGGSYNEQTKQCDK